MFPYIWQKVWENGVADERLGNLKLTTFVYCGEVDHINVLFLDELPAKLFKDCFIILYIMMSPLSSQLFDTPTYS